MSFKYSKGAQVIGDLKAQDDTQRDTQIDFGEDYIGFETSGSLRLKISGSDGSITFNEAFTFPISDGNVNQVLQTNGSGQLTWANQSGGGGGGGSQFFQGHVEIDTTAKPVNFHNVVSIGGNAPENIKSWFIAPFNGQVNKVILSVKANNFSTSNDGTVTVFIYKNQSNFNSATAIAVAADSFVQTVNNLGTTNGDVNTGTFNTNVSIQEGDLIQIKVEKSTGDLKDAVVTLKLTEQ
tara:strand:+ start:65 stop:775 length:711 start_codon:yes stop_codon:yes gene_type:complete